MTGKEYLFKKFGYIKKLSALIIAANFFYFFVMWVIDKPAIDLETIFIICFGINIISASVIINQVKGLFKSVK